MQAEPWFYRCLTIPNVPNWCCEVAIVSSNLVPCFESQKGQGHHYCDFPQICNVTRGLITIHDSPCWLCALKTKMAMQIIIIVVSRGNAMLPGGSITIHDSPC